MAPQEMEIYEINNYSMLQRIKSENGEQKQEFQIVFVNSTLQ